MYFDANSKRRKLSLQREKELLVVANLLQVISMSQTTENSERGTVAACFALAERLAELGTK